MTTLSAPIKIIIADDHPLCLSGFKRMLDSPGFELLAEAGNGEELVQLSIKLKPDIVITDIKMPRMNGIEATRQIIKELPTIGVIAISVIDEYNLIMDMIDAGAKGYLLKSVHPDEIMAAVHSVHNGEIYYCKETTSHMVKMLARQDYKAMQEDAISQFSEIEINTIKLICRGDSNKEIATNLNLKKRKIEWHRQQIMQKLGVKNTAGITIFAIKNKLC
jgi:DNA-binding NarL/FixJ family response regulator